MKPAAKTAGKQRKKTTVQGPKKQEKKPEATAAQHKRRGNDEQDDDDEAAFREAKEIAYQERLDIEQRAAANATVLSAKISAVELRCPQGHPLLAHLCAVYKDFSCDRCSGPFAA